MYDRGLLLAGSRRNTKRQNPVSCTHLYTHPQSFLYLFLFFFATTYAIHMLPDILYLLVCFVPLLDKSNRGWNSAREADLFSSSSGIMHVMSINWRLSGPASRVTATSTLSTTCPGIVV